MFGEYSLMYGAVVMSVTFSVLMLLSACDTCDAASMFSRRYK